MLTTIENVSWRACLCMFYKFSSIRYDEYCTKWLRSNLSFIQQTQISLVQCLVTCFFIWIWIECSLLNSVLNVCYSCSTMCIIVFHFIGVTVFNILHNDQDVNLVVKKCYKCGYFPCSRVCGNPHGLIRKYGIMCCRQCFKTNAKEIGFIKVICQVLTGTLDA